MQKITKLLSLLAIFSITCSATISCSDDDNKNVPDLVLMSFLTDFPSATNIDWDKKGSYYVADFDIIDQDIEAWYSASGVWEMTLAEMTYSSLPLSVQNSFTNSTVEFGTVQECYMLMRMNMLDNYLIRTRSSTTGYVAYFAPDGTMLMDGMNSSIDDIYPPNLPTAITSAIATNYPTGVIASYKSTPIEGAVNMVVTVLDNSDYLMVVFSNDYQWQYTYWSVEQADLPSAVTTTFQNSQYASMTIANIYYYSLPSGGTNYYVIQVETNNTSNPPLENVYIDVNGNLLDM